MRLQSITEIRPCLIVLSINSLFQNEVIERLISIGETQLSVRKFVHRGFRSKPLLTSAFIVFYFTLFPFKRRWKLFVLWHPWLPRHHA